MVKQDEPKNPEDEQGESPEQKAMSDALKKMAENLDKPNNNSIIGDKKEGSATSPEVAVAWEKVLSKFPKQLQEEFKVERPSPTQEDIEAYDSLRLVDPKPQSVPLEELLKDNEDCVLRSAPDVIEEINKKWGTKFEVKGSKVYDQNPGRVREYSKMPAETAQPSVSVDGGIMFGSGRFIAALLRKDKDIKVWNLSRKLEEK